MSKKCTHCGKRIGFFSSYEVDGKLYCRKCYDGFKWVWHTDSGSSSTVTRNLDLCTTNESNSELTDTEAWHATQTMMGGNSIDTTGM